MRPIVMKFGGTSLADTLAFANVASIVAEHSDQHPVIVVSAMSGMTDALLSSVQAACSGDFKSAAAALEPPFERQLEVASALLSSESYPEFVSVDEAARENVRELFYHIAMQPLSRPRLQDEVVSFGERLSARLLVAVLSGKGVRARNVDSRGCITTDDNYGYAAPLMEETCQKTRAELNPLIETSVVPVLAGFIGSTANGETTTLGRGGSDYSAALVAAILSAREIQIWTDVTGMLTADPRVVSNARTIPRLSYAEAAELAYFGAKVLHPKTIEPAIDWGIPVRICNSRLPKEPGTLVCAETESSPEKVKAIANKMGVTTVQITSARMLGAYGFLRAIFEIFDRHRTVIDVVTTSEVSVSLSLDDARALPSIIRELETLGAVSVEEGRAIICVVGEGLRSTPGIAARVFSTISDINVSLISQGASRINLTFAVAQDQAHEAVQRLHEEFFGESKVQSPRSRVMASRS